MTSPTRILIIDDDELDRMAARRALSRASFTIEVVEASTGEEGLALYATQAFDAVLLDYRLPDIDGLDVLSRMRASEHKQAAVIVLSRQEDERLAELCIDAGAQDFLLKDEISERRLTRAIRQAKQRFAMEEKLHQAQVDLKHIAERDRLTGLANRYCFEVALQMELARTKRGKGHLAVVLLDLDDFKTVNDTLGHDAGDVLLNTVAERLSTAVRDSDLLARLGGDEFVVLVNDIKRDDQVDLLAQRLLHSLHDPIDLNGTKWIVSTSIGISILDAEHDTSMDLMKCADLALYQAKREGRNRIHFYSDSLNQEVQRRTSIEYDLRSAIANDQFRVFYQAKVAANGQTLVGMEALLRWQHPTRGLLAPDAFLDIAEEKGLMAPIGDWVLRTTCRQLMQWKPALETLGLKISLAVNLSAIQMRSDSLADLVIRTMGEYGLSAGCLEFEITENTLIENTDQCAKVLQSLADLGVTLSLDDFGTGYSSLQHLKLFPINALKIDRDFVAKVGQDERDNQLVAAMISVAKILNLSVVAEGVETAEQAEFCRVHGCDVLQGYYFSRPISAEDFEARYLAPIALAN